MEVLSTAHTDLPLRRIGTAAGQTGQSRRLYVLTPQAPELPGYFWEFRCLKFITKHVLVFSSLSSASRWTPRAPTGKLFEADELPRREGAM